jgi:hypothetical protein
MQARTALFRMMERAGFTLVRCRKHAVWRCPCGHTNIVTAATPGGNHHVASNAEGQMRRALLTCQRNLKGTT